MELYKHWPLLVIVIFLLAILVFKLFIKKEMIKKICSIFFVLNVILFLIFSLFLCVQLQEILMILNFFITLFIVFSFINRGEKNDI